MTRIVKYVLFFLTVIAVAGQEESPPPPPETTANDVATTNEVGSSRRSESSSRSSSRYGRDITALGENIVVKEGDVAKDVTVIGGSAMIDGKVTGDLVVIGGLVVLGPTAEVSRDITIVGGGLEADPAAKVSGDRVVLDWNPQVPAIPGMEGLHAWITQGLMKGRPFAPQVEWTWWAGGIFLLLYLVLALLFPAPLQASMGVLDARPGSSFLTGLLAFVLFAPLLILLAFTVIGIILVPFLVCGALAAYLFGKAAVYGYAGRRLGGRIEFLRHPVVAVIIGAVVFYLLYMIPVLGFLVWGVVAPLGVGAVLLAFFSKVRSERPKPAAPVVTDPPIPPAASAEPLPPATPAQGSAPRAGFWLRFLATVIDAALVVTICKLVELRGPGIILLWSVYHIALWTWRGATVGGMILGLRLVQTDGRPMTLGVALVRFLASFLSAAGLLLGFFWAGWSATKQSWHDIIAGTYVLKAKSKPVPVSQPA